MEIAGIRFAPFNTPWRRRLQTLATASAYLTIEFGAIVGAIFLFYLFFYADRQVEVVMYLIWAYIIDRKTCEEGDRRSEWFCNLNWWTYIREYYPINFVKVDWLLEPDPKKNYLFCCFPHGIIPVSPVSLFCSKLEFFRTYFPNHSPYFLLLKQYFYAPLLRDIILSLGARASSEKTLNWFLGQPKGGYAVALMVGGSAEVFNAIPGEYKVVLKKRKGFVRIAIKNGSPLVPIFTFGETDLFHQPTFQNNSFVRKFQNWYKDVTGFPFVIPMGRGFFQYSFGILPHRKTLNSVIGKPIDVVKSENPSQEEIDKVHERFIRDLVNLFEEYKHKFVENPEDVKLIVE